MMEKYHFELEGRELTIPYLTSLPVAVFTEALEAAEQSEKRPHLLMNVIIKRVLKGEDAEYFGETMTTEAFFAWFEKWTTSSPAAVNLPQ